MKTNKPLKAKTGLKARAKPKKQKKPSITILRRRADKVFSLAIRYRDSELIKGEWVGRCITCQARVPLRKAHAGHFQSRRYPATRWDYENVNLQCTGDNVFNGGEQYKYGLEIDLKYGSGTAKKLYKQARQEFKVTRTFLEDVIATAEAEIEYYEQQL